MVSTIKKKFRVDGEVRELSSIGVLAKKLDRVPQTLRKWEKMGMFPTAKYIDSLGRRFYSQEQINAIARVIKELKVVPGSSLEKTGMRERVIEILREVN